MTSKIRWSLPDGVDELLPPKALQVETLRRSLVDKYIDSGYEFIIPPLLELSETIGGEAHDEIKSHAFSFKDNLTGKNLSIRPDISEQASRIDAYRIQSDETVRLCYAGEVVKSKSSKVLRFKLIELILVVHQHHIQEYNGEKVTLHPSRIEHGKLLD